MGGEIAAAKPRFHMGHGHPLVEGGKRAAEGGGGVPLDDGQIRLKRREDRGAG